MGRLEEDASASSMTMDELSDRLRPSSLEAERGVLLKLRAQRGAEPPS